MARGAGSGADNGWNYVVLESDEISMEHHEPELPNVQFEVEQAIAAFMHSHGSPGDIAQAANDMAGAWDGATYRSGRGAEPLAFARHVSVYPLPQGVAVVSSYEDWARAQCKLVVACARTSDFGGFTTEFHSTFGKYFTRPARYDFRLPLRSPGEKT